MKAIRSKLADYINSKVAKREELALKEYKRVKDSFSDLTSEEDHQLTKDYYTFLRFNVEERVHAEIDHYAMALAREKEKSSHREDLYLWWYITTYLVEIAKWKLTKPFRTFFDKL